MSTRGQRSPICCARLAAATKRSQLCRDGLAAAPRASALWRALGLSELARGRGNEARAAFDRALSLQPGDAETHYNRGVALQVGRKRRAAQNAYRRALALAPDLTAAGYNAGVVLRELGRSDAAVAAFECVIAQDPAHVAAHNALCETLHESGRIDDWLRAFRRFEASCPDALPLAVQALEACQYQATSPRWTAISIACAAASSSRPATPSSSIASKRCCS